MKKRPISKGNPQGVLYDDYLTAYIHTPSVLAASYARMMGGSDVLPQRMSRLLARNSTTELETVRQRLFAPFLPFLGRSAAGRAWSDFLIGVVLSFSTVIDEMICSAACTGLI